MARLLHTDMWQTLPLIGKAPFAGSQRWHRDPEDLRILKMFFYLSDVSVDAGPLNYVCNSRRGEKYGDLWPQKLPYGNVAPHDEVEKATLVSARHSCAYPAGTLIFVDTTGLHMGGRATNGERLLATWTFVTQASPYLRRFSIPDVPLLDGLSVATRFALYDQA